MLETSKAKTKQFRRELTKFLGRASGVVMGWPLVGNMDECPRFFLGTSIFVVHLFFLDFRPFFIFG